jgi:hypothetical protein
MRSSDTKGNKMDINDNNAEWITATNHQAFTDKVAPIVDSLTRSLYEQIAKVVGFDNLNANDEDEYDTTNALNSIVAEVLFESMTPLQLRELLASHNTDN